VFLLLTSKSMSFSYIFLPLLPMFFIKDIYKIDYTNSG
jgi:hypothetical protein